MTVAPEAQSTGIEEDQAMEGDAAEILKLEQQRCQAELDGDIDALGRLLDDTLIYVHGSGIVDNKKNLLISRKNLKWLVLTRHDLQVHVSGDIAVLTGVLSFQTRDIGASEVLAGKAFATQVLARRGEQWWFIVHQATRLKT